jgi:hypothetical protein
LRAEAVGLDEQDVEHDRARLLRGQAFDQIGVDLARPREAAGHVLHRGETLFIHIDEHHVGIGR